MNRIIIISLLLCSIQWMTAQSIDDTLDNYNDESIPYISVRDLKENYDKYIILDSRKKEEYEVSHLPGAIWIGKKEALHKFLATQPDRSKPIVVYCSIGVRSEDAGTFLTWIRFTDVKNLYGGIFMWKDAGNQVLDNNENPTEKVHVYSKQWAGYLKTGEKVY